LRIQLLHERLLRVNTRRKRVYWLSVVSVLAHLDRPSSSEEAELRVPIPPLNWLHVVRSRCGARLTVYPSSNLDCSRPRNQ